MWGGYEIPVQLIEYLIVHKSWWDTVDFVAPKLAGPLFIKAPVERKKTARKWVTSGNTWLVRSALLMQLKYKKETDFELMCSVIGECAVDNEFFVRKAIGWTLREYSKTNPKAVMGFVAKQEMSALSKKEALKRITAKNKS